MYVNVILHKISVQVSMLHGCVATMCEIQLAKRCSIQFYVHE